MPVERRAHRFGDIDTRAREALDLARLDRDEGAGSSTTSAMTPRSARACREGHGGCRGRARELRRAGSTAESAHFGDAVRGRLSVSEVADRDLAYSGPAARGGDVLEWNG